jgi:RNA polymerase sigma-70 factor, ECF subfamily
MIPSPVNETNDAALVQRLRDGDEAAFMMVVEMYQSAMIRLALMYVHDQASAEEVVQETWVAVLNGLHRFEGRSSLKTWIFSILMNRARTRASREGRTIPMSALGDEDDEPFEPAVAPERFRPPDDPRYPGHWTVFPSDWSEVPEQRMLSLEVQTVIRDAINALPPNQREVITLRDVNGMSASEACNILEVSESNQRVLLHRARAKVQRALEHYFKGD